MSSAAPAAPRALRVDRGTIIQWAVAAFTVVLVIGPIVPIVLQSVMGKPLYDGFGALSLANYRELFTSADVGEAVWTSLVSASTRKAWIRSPSRRNSVFAREQSPQKTPPRWRSTSSQAIASSSRSR